MQLTHKETWEDWLQFQISFHLVDGQNDAHLFLKWHFEIEYLMQHDLSIFNGQNCISHICFQFK